MTATMKAAVLRGTEDLAIEEIPVPDPGPGQVRVRIASVGVCGSDVHYYDHGRIGGFVVEQPMILGHESGGVIDAVGAGVDRARVGQRVSIEPGVPDLTCHYCRTGAYNLCPNMRFYATPPIDGSLSQYALVHEAFAYPVPDSMSDDAAALIEPLSVGIWANRKAHTAPGSRVLITGAGPIGLVATQCAREFGATTIVVSDVNDYRLGLARDLGATDVHDASGGGIDGEFDALIECSGHPGATRAGILALAPGARGILVGMGGDELTIPLGHLQNKEIELTGTFRYANTWPTAISLVAGGRVDVDRLVTGHFGLDDTVAALLAGRTDPHAVKSIIRPQE